MHAGCKGYNLDKSCHKQITKVTITAQFLGKEKKEDIFIVTK